MVSGTYIPPTSYPRLNPMTPSQGGARPSGGGGSGVGDVLSLGKNVIGKKTGLTSGLTSSVNSFGAGLGFAPGTLSYSGIGPAALPWAQPGMLAPSYMAGSAGVAPTAGALGGTGTLMGTLGGAGIGALGGGLLAKWTGGNETGGSIGGGLGGGIAAAAGLGPIGIGAAILGGGLLGGMFGNNKPSNKQQVGVVNLGANETFDLAHTMLSQTGKKFSQDNANVRNAMEDAVVNFQTFLRDNGATSNANDTLVLKVGSRDGLAYYFKPTPERYVSAEAGEGMVQGQGGYYSEVFESFQAAKDATDKAAEENKKYDVNIVVGKDHERWRNEIVAGILERHDIPEDLQMQLDNMDVMGTFFSLGGGGSQGQGGGRGPIVAQAPMIDKGLPSAYNFQNFLQDYNTKTPQQVNQANPLT